MRGKHREGRRSSKSCSNESKKGNKPEAIILEGTKKWIVKIHRR